MNDSQRRAALDKLAKEVVVAARDRTLDDYGILVGGHRRGVHGEQLQRKYNSLSSEAKEVLEFLVYETLNDCIHNLLFAIQEAYDLELGVDLVVDGVSVCEASDGLQGEPFTDQGWIYAFGRYPEMPTSASAGSD